MAKAKTDPRMCTIFGRTEIFRESTSQAIRCANMILRVRIGRKAIADALGAEWLTVAA